MKSIYKTATLFSDMAHRIMFEYLPYDRFDFTAARWAARGVIDLVYYSTRGIIKELNAFRGNKDIFVEKARELRRFSKDNIEQYAEFLELAVVAFYSKDWHEAYGGPKWATIANKTLDLVNDYKQYISVEKNSDEEKLALKKIIRDMNIFDGLAHNTNTVYDKMLNAEGDNLGKMPIEKSKDIQRIYKLRDLSELEEPIWLFKEIEQELHPKEIYKDTITKLHSDPDYHSTETAEGKIQYIKDLKWFRMFIRHIKTRLVDKKDGLQYRASLPLVLEFPETLAGNSNKYHTVSNIFSHFIITFDEVKDKIADYLWDFKKERNKYLFEKIISSSTPTIISDVIKSLEAIEDRAEYSKGDLFELPHEAAKDNPDIPYIIKDYNKALENCKILESKINIALDYLETLIQVV